MELTKVVEDQKGVIGILEGKVHSMTRGIKMMNFSTKILDEILEKGKKSMSNSGIGCTTREARKKGPTTTRWIASSHQHGQSSERKYTWRYYHCGRKGDIAPYCYKIYGKGRRKYYQSKMQWLTKIEKLKGYCVTFGGGAKGKITGKGCLSMDGLPELENVLLVDGLTVNLISISQLCDEGMKVAFTKEACTKRGGCINMAQKFGHTNYRNIQQLISKEVVKGLPKLEIKEKICGECQVGKQTKVSHQLLQQVFTTRVLELLHMDLMGPMQVENIRGKKDIYVLVDDFSRYTWVKFIREKYDAFDAFQQLVAQIQREKGMAIIRIRSDHGKEFGNSKFNEFCSLEGIKHEFSALITPQQNGIFERKNRTIQEIERTIEEDNNVTPTGIDSIIGPAARIQKTHPVGNIIGEMDRGMTTRRKDRVDYKKMVGLFAETCFLSKIEPKDLKVALQDENWINAMQEELVEFERNEV
ncbi:hypothetical protein LIER_10294 [Lithospermum erythrorhizon]|uniref:Integrase catalytic domain-containing protein n=1 Tax=Lithospermum erythrorhizon TaxID=34254 RepID=A0AAV3PL17_LITER